MRIRNTLQIFTTSLRLRKHVIILGYSHTNAYLLRRNSFILLSKTQLFEKGKNIMKNKKALFPVLASALLLTMGLAACNKPAEGSKAGESVTSAQTSGEEEKIVITAAGGKKEIQVGETLQLTASVEGVEWSTKNTDIATVSATGLVTAVKDGSARITAKKDGYANGTFTLTVTKAPDRQAKYSLRLEEAEHYDPDDFWGMSFGGTVMGPGDSPVEDNSGATDDGTSLGWLQQGCKETMRFTSDKAAKVEMGVTMAYNAEMNLSGVLAVKFNNAEISMEGKTVSAPETEGSYYEFHTVSFGQVDLIAGQNVLEIEMLAQGPNMDKVVFFTNETLTITAVPAQVKPKIEFVADALQVEVDSTVQIQVKNNLAGLTYTSSDATVASVSNTGLVTGVKSGKATITVTKEGYKDGKVEVTVKAKASDITTTVTPVADNTATEQGVTYLEAEEATLIRPEGADETQNLVVEDTATAHGGKSLGYVNKDNKVEFTFNASAAGKVNLRLTAASTKGTFDFSTFSMKITEQVVADCVEIKLNGTALNLAEVVLPGNDTGSYTNWQDINFGEVACTEGLNTITIDINDQGPNLDCFKVKGSGSVVVTIPAA